MSSLAVKATELREFRMTMSPQVVALDQQIDDAKRRVKAQTLLVTDLIKADGDTQDAERVLWGLMDLLSGLRDRRFRVGNLDHMNVHALGIVENGYDPGPMPEDCLTQASNELVHRLNDLPLGGTVFLTKAEFERIFEGDDAGRRFAAIFLTEQCGCRLLFRDHAQTRAVITRKQRRSEANAPVRALA